MKHYCKLVPIWLFILLLLFSLRTTLFAVDFHDTGLLTTSLRRNSDINFQKLCEYYGLLCRVIDLSAITLTDSLLRDEGGERLKAVFINDHTLENSGYLDSNETEILKDGVEIGGISLFIFMEEIANSRESLLKKLTDNGDSSAKEPASRGSVIAWITLVNDEVILEIGN